MSASRVPFSSRPLSALLRRSLHPRINKATRRATERSTEQRNNHIPIATTTTTCTTSNTANLSNGSSSTKSSSSSSQPVASIPTPLRNSNSTAATLLLQQQQQQQRHHHHPTRSKLSQLVEEQRLLSASLISAPPANLSVLNWLNDYDEVWEDGTGFGADEQNNIDYYYINDLPITKATIDISTTSSILSTATTTAVTIDSIDSNVFPIEWFQRSSRKRPEEQISQEEDQDEEDNNQQDRWESESSAEDSYNSKLLGLAMLALTCGEPTDEDDELDGDAVIVEHPTTTRTAATTTAASTTTSNIPIPIPQSRTDQLNRTTSSFSSPTSPLSTSFSPSYSPLHTPRTPSSRAQPRNNHINRDHSYYQRPSSYSPTVAINTPSTSSSSSSSSLSSSASAGAILSTSSPSSSPPFYLSPLASPYYGQIDPPILSTNEDDDQQNVTAGNRPTQFSLNSNLIDDYSGYGRRHEDRIQEDSDSDDEHDKKSQDEMSISSSSSSSSSLSSSSSSSSSPRLSPKFDPSILRRVEERIRQQKQQASSSFHSASINAQQLGEKAYSSSSSSSFSARESELQNHNLFQSLVSMNGTLILAPAHLSSLTAWKHLATFLLHSRRVITLSFDGVLITPDAIRALGNGVLTEIRELIFVDNQIGLNEETLQMIIDLLLLSLSLHTVALIKNSLRDVTQLERLLLNHKCLTSLSLCYNGIETAGAARLANILSPPANSSLFSSSYPAIPLKSLDLNCNRIDHRGTQQLTQLQQLLQDRVQISFANNQSPALPATSAPTSPSLIPPLSIEWCLKNMHLAHLNYKRFFSKNNPPPARTINIQCSPSNIPFLLLSPLNRIPTTSNETQHNHNNTNEL